MGFSVRVWDRAWTAVNVDGLRLRVVRYAAAAMGGPTTAEFVMDGRLDGRVGDWLRYAVEIVNEQGSAVWWGYVGEVVTEAPGGESSVRLEGTANRVQVAYSTMTGAELTADETDWASDAASVALYGTIERRESLGDSDATQATARRDRVLALTGRPATDLRLRSGGKWRMRFVCVGWAETLGWKYFEWPQGRKEYWAQTTAGTMRVGWGFTATTVGFVGDGKRIHERDGKLAGLNTGEQVRVTGSASNNGWKTVTARGSGEAETYTATTIEFDPVDDILDSADGIGFLRVGDVVEVSGGGTNNGSHLIDDSGTDHVTVDTAWGGSIDAVAAGPSVTLKRGTNVEISESVTNELPGASVTVTAVGAKVGQVFQVGEAWTATRVGVKVAAVGAPADNLLIRICSVSAGLPNATLGTATIAGSAVGASATEVWGDLDVSVALSAATDYALVVERSGSLSTSDYYSVAVDAGAGGGADGLTWDTGWMVASPAMDVLFGVWGTEDTAVQAARVLTTCGQFFAVVERRATSGIATNQWRDGTRLGDDELRALLESGTSTGGRLVWRVGRQREVVLAAEPVYAVSTVLRWEMALGRLTTPQGQETERGVLPVGEWIEVVKGLEVSAMFVEEAEYDVDGAAMRLASRRLEDLLGFGVVNR